MIWSDEVDSNESILMKELKKLPCEILFIDGNHENFNRLAKLKNIKRFGGNVGEYIKNKRFHLKRCEIYNIAGKISLQWVVQKALIWLIESVIFRGGRQKISLNHKLTMLCKICKILKAILT